MLLVLCAVFYSAWLGEFALSSGADPIRTYVSELAAVDQPYGAFFRTTDLLAGVFAGVAAFFALLSTRRSPWATAGWAALGVFGAATAVDSRFPLSCAPVADRGCYERDAAGLAPVDHVVHAVTSSVAAASALAAMTTLTISTVMAARHGRTSVLGRYGPPVVIAQWGTGLWLMCAVIAFYARHINLWLGLAERVQGLLIAIWLVLLAAEVARGTSTYRFVAGHEERHRGPRSDHEQRSNR